MAHSSLLYLSLCLFVLFHGCLGQIQQVTSESCHQQQQRGLERFQTECQLRRINPLRSDPQIKSEAGVTEIWYQNQEELQCAGVVVVGHKIQQRGLLLPSFNNASLLIYVGGIHEAAFPGCAETFNRLEEGSGGVMSTRRSFSLLETHKKKSKDTYRVKGKDVERARGASEEAKAATSGRIRTVNSFNLPILGHIRLSAEHGFLYRNGIYAPHWNINAHSIVYVTRGTGRAQIEDNHGQQLCDGELEEGQLVVVPQKFAVTKKATSEGFKWIAFKTNENAKISQLVGRVSIAGAIPEEVLMNSFRISREEARRLKFNRQEANPGSKFQVTVRVRDGVRATVFSRFVSSSNQM